MKTRISYLSKSDFTRLKGMMNAFMPNSVTDDYAFTFSSKGGNVIIINKDNNLSPNEMKIVLEHEKAHTKGFDNEEDADYEAMRHLNKEQRKILIQNWKTRHGHEYMP